MALAFLNNHLEVPTPMLWSFCDLPYHGSWCSVRHEADPVKRTRAAYWHLRWLDRHIPQKCEYPIHGLWCAHDLHPTPRTSPEPSRGYNSNHSLLPELNHHKVRTQNPSLAEEVSILNSIYGEGTLLVLRLQAKAIRLRLVLPIGKAGAYWLNFAKDYPSSPPCIEQAELSLHETTDRRVQNIYLILIAVLNEVFVPGNVCLFDLVNAALPVIASLRDQRFDEEIAEQFLPGIDLRRWDWTRKAFINMSTAKDKAECVICCEESFIFEMVPASCEHHFCFECFATGWDITRETAEPYTCCLQEIGLKTITSCLTVSDETLHRYKCLLREKRTPNPFFCGNRDFGLLIGNLTKWDLTRGQVKRFGVQCNYCKAGTCVNCRDKWHPGACMPEDSGLKELLDQGIIRRCHNCGQAVEKNGGCRHMTCYTCYSHRWWKRDGTLEDYSLHKHRLHLLEEDEEFLDDEGNAFRMAEAPELNGEEAVRALQRIEELRLQRQEEAQNIQLPEAEEVNADGGEQLDAG